MRDVRCERKLGISFPLRPRCAIEVAFQPVTVIESPSGLANHQTSIAIRRYPERFVCAIASGARERGHLLLSQHTRKKACDNYYGEYASPLSLSSLSFHPHSLRATPRCAPTLFIYTPFSSTSAHAELLLLALLLFLSSSSFRGTLRGHSASKMLRKIRHKRDKISVKM